MVMVSFARKRSSKRYTTDMLVVEDVMTSGVARQAFVAIRPYDWTVTAELLAQDPTTGLSMADRAYTVIKDRLIMLDIRPNDPIDDGALALELGIGRTPVREALKRLETDRL